MVKKPIKDVRVRLAPSPTGPLHLGTARTGLFNWLFARQNGGKFILRIEDTDKERSEKRYEEGIVEGLRWLGLEWDEGPFRQSERFSVYKKYLEKLLKERKAYYCYCTKEDLEAQRQAMMAEGLPPKYNGHCRNLKKVPDRKPEVIRFLTPEGKVEFEDLVRGKVGFDGSLIGDMVIAKDLDTPLYNFAVVVDDFEMKISHVIRGEDHLSNTPKQILLQQALSFDVPIFGHLPLILDSNRAKLSKRFAETSLLSYRDKGYLPEAMVNFMALLGWHPKGDQEIFSREEMIEMFDISKVQKAGAIFDQEKLSWINSEHVKKMPISELANLIRPIIEEKGFEFDRKFVEKILESERLRLKLISDFWGVADFFFAPVEFESKLLKWKTMALPDVKIILEKVFEATKSIAVAKDFGKNFRVELESLANQFGKGEVFWPTRVAISGRSTSPDPIQIASILGRDEVLRRIQKAIDKLGEVNDINFDEPT